MIETLFLNGAPDPHLAEIMHGLNAYANENNRAPMPKHPLIDFDNAIQGLMSVIEEAPREHAADMLEVLQCRLANAQAAFFKRYHCGGE